MIWSFSVFVSFFILSHFKTIPPFNILYPLFLVYCGVMIHQPGIISPKYSECCDVYSSSLGWDIDIWFWKVPVLLLVMQVSFACCLVMSVSWCIHDCDVMFYHPLLENILLARNGTVIFWPPLQVTASKWPPTNCYWYTCRLYIFWIFNAHCSTSFTILNCLCLCCNTNASLLTLLN